jgi:hypothetical protein
MISGYIWMSSFSLREKSQTGKSDKMAATPWDVTPCILVEVKGKVLPFQA